MYILIEKKNCMVKIWIMVVGWTFTKRFLFCSIQPDLYDEQPTPATDVLGSSRQGRLDCWDRSCSEMPKWRCFSVPCLLVSMPDASRSFEEQQLETCTPSAMSWLLGHDLLQKRASTSQPQIQRFTGSMAYQTRGGWTKWLVTLALTDCWLVHVYRLFSSCFFYFMPFENGLNLFLPPVYNHKLLKQELAQYLDFKNP